MANAAAKISPTGKSLCSILLATLVLLIRSYMTPGGCLQRVDRRPDDAVTLESRLEKQRLDQDFP